MITKRNPFSLTGLERPVESMIEAPFRSKTCCQLMWNSHAKKHLTSHGVWLCYLRSRQRWNPQHCHWNMMTTSSSLREYNDQVPSSALVTEVWQLRTFRKRETSIADLWPGLTLVSLSALLETLWSQTHQYDSPFHQKKNRRCYSFEERERRSRPIIHLPTINCGCRLLDGNAFCPFFADSRVQTISKRGLGPVSCHILSTLDPLGWQFRRSH